MSIDFAPLALLLLFPALGVVFHLFFGPHLGRRAVNVVGPGVIFAAFAVSLWALARLLTLPPGAALRLTLWHWIAAGGFRVDFALRCDALSAVMAAVVSGVGAFIHLYSVGYMHEDEDYARYFAYMNLFTLAMLVLVTASNLLLMFVGWEGVGLCSYLLIGFWYQRPGYAYNGRKAFIVNRVGDAGFVLGLLLIAGTLAGGGVLSFDFTALAAHRAALKPVAGAVCLLLFLGATGKSAQIPLYVWLPDAMVGPTPVSALIHAATMVTAGVYMVARLHFLYALSPAALLVVATVGALTSFFAATIALVQTDIKRVLAYSTISQIGYMFLGVGVGAFSAGIFHLYTHAFFKALLFLCAGAVIHALGGEQDMSRMGGLRRALPLTYWTMLAATLAIVAVPGFSGYFSKDLILEKTLGAGAGTLWLLGVVTAGLTSFYMFRLIFLTFHGETRLAGDRYRHLHDAPPVMAVALVVLALFSVGAGWVGLPPGFWWGDAFARFLAPATGALPEAAAGAAVGALAQLAPTLAMVTGLVWAWLFYLAFPGLPALLASQLAPLHALLWRKYYVDEVYDLVVSRPLFWLAERVLGGVVDAGLIDGLVDRTGLAVETGGELARLSETGNVQDYALVYLAGAVLIVGYYAYLVLR